LAHQVHILYLATIKFQASHGQIYLANTAVVTVDFLSSYVSCWW